MISNVQEPRGGTGWSVHILGCHSRRARSAHPKKMQDSGRNVDLPGETAVTLPKSENTPVQQPRGRGAGDPQGHWSSMARQWKVSAHREEP